MERMTGYNDSTAGNSVFRDLKDELDGLGYGFYYTPEAASTNDWAAAACRNGCGCPALFLTDSQTNGKGRLGRSWSAEKGASLTFSILIRPECISERIPCYTEVFGLSLCTALRSLGVEKAMIKWPNDIVVSGKKISGTLTETASDLSRIIIGTGINLTKKAYPNELAYKASSLEECSYLQPDILCILSAVLKNFEKDREIFARSGSMKDLAHRYDSLLVNIGRKTTITENGNSVSGRATGIDELGRLIFQKENGERILVHSGEASVSGIY